MEGLFPASVDDCSDGEEACDDGVGRGFGYDGEGGVHGGWMRGAVVGQGVGAGIEVIEAENE